MTKVNPQTMKTQYDGQYDTFCRKNHDYGNSFEESLDQFGIVASIVRMSDKMNRLESLTDESKTQQVGSESLLDTLEDLSNYAAMTACWLKGVREEDGENTIYADNKPVVTYKEDTSKYEADVTIGNDWELTDAVQDVVTMLKVVFKLHCKIEEFKMTKEDYEELDHITNRLRSMVNDGTISEELMRKLIDIHVKLNKDSLIYQLFKQPEDTVKHLLKDLYTTVFAFHDRRLPICTHLECLGRQKEIYNQFAKMVLNNSVDYGTIATEVNSSTELNIREKKSILESIVAAAYEIDSENFPGFDRNSEFLNKTFHIPEEVEEPEEKEGLGDNLFKVLLWLLPLNKEY